MKKKIPVICLVLSLALVVVLGVQLAHTAAESRRLQKRIDSGFVEAFAQFASVVLPAENAETMEEASRRRCEMDTARYLYLAARLSISSSYRTECENLYFLVARLNFLSQTEKLSDVMTVEIKKDLMYLSAHMRDMEEADALAAEIYEQIKDVS